MGSVTLFTSTQTKLFPLSFHSHSQLGRRPRPSGAAAITCSSKRKHPPPLPVLCDTSPPLPGLSVKPLTIISAVNKFSSSLLQCGALFASVGRPAIAVTGNNNDFDDDLSWTLIQSGVIAVWYFLVMPPVIMNWLRLRRYKRKFFEMYLQFMFVFLFFPGILLWAPFINFRRLPRDPTMKYPWSTPQDASVNNPRS